jgi:hypothetical protein
VDSFATAPPVQETRERIAALGRGRADEWGLIWAKMRE